MRVEIDGVLLKFYKVAIDNRKTDQQTSYFNSAFLQKNRCWIVIVLQLVQLPGDHMEIVPELLQ